MSIYDKVRGGKPINPAIALYNYWHMVLSGRPDGFTQGSGRPLRYVQYAGWDLQFRDAGSITRPNIAFGGSFEITSQGDFRLLRPHGGHQRDVIATNTFLRWRYLRGYNWLVDTSSRAGGYDSHYGSELMDWQNPVHYMNEWPMRARSAWSLNPWSKLTWDDAFGWRINFSRNDDSHKYAPCTSQDEYDHFDRIRERRYRLAEREHLIATGVLERTERKYLTAEERAEAEEQNLQVIVAHFDVSQAARTIPLRRDREEGLWQLHGCP